MFQGISCLRNRSAQFNAEWVRVAIKRVLFLSAVSCQFIHSYSRVESPVTLIVWWVKSQYNQYYVLYQRHSMTVMCARNCFWLAVACSYPQIKVCICLFFFLTNTILICMSSFFKLICWCTCLHFEWVHFISVGFSSCNKNSLSKFWAHDLFSLLWYSETTKVLVHVK
jgi:hypothetical protein